MSTDSAYKELITRLKRTHLLGSVAELLGWDEQVNLPVNSADQRAEQQATLAEVQHESASAERIGMLLTELEAATLPADQRAVVALARKDYDRATKLPADFVRDKAVQDSRGYHAWAKARAESDFSHYAPVLEKNLEFAQREARFLGWDGREYDYMLDKHDPDLSAATVTRLFDELKRDLVPLMRDITAAASKVKVAELKGFPIEGQKVLLREVTEKLGFDYQRGRIDVSLHPFCSGTGADVRMTTRFKEDEPLDSLFGAVHETGHGLYEQGLPLGDHGTALGMHAGMAVHESQSRLWENQVARSRGFWKFFEPRFRALFSDQTKGVSSEELYRAINAVAPTLIRVDADEVTYNLHIVLRFELERRLFSGELAVRDLPKAWNALAQELLGLTPDSDRTGVLQDIHWSSGAFGYFPSYCLGNMMASQLWYHVLTLRPELEQEFAHGDFSWLLAWLRENVHAQGRRYSMGALVKRITGEELSPKYLVRYLRERYGALYL